jgi:hypothetical protein
VTRSLERKPHFFGDAPQRDAHGALRTLFAFRLFVLWCVHGCVAPLDSGLSGGAPTSHFHATATRDRCISPHMQRRPRRNCTKERRSRERKRTEPLALTTTDARTCMGGGRVRSHEGVASWSATGASMGWHHWRTAGALLHLHAPWRHVVLAARVDVAPLAVLGLRDQAHHELRVTPCLREERAQQLRITCTVQHAHATSRQVGSSRIK